MLVDVPADDNNNAAANPGMFKLVAKTPVWIHQGNFEYCDKLEGRRDPSTIDELDWLDDTPPVNP